MTKNDIYDIQYIIVRIQVREWPGTGERVGKIEFAKELSRAKRIVLCSWEVKILVANLAVKELLAAGIISCSPDGPCYSSFFLN